MKAFPVVILVFSSVDYFFSRLDAFAAVIADRLSVDSLFLVGQNFGDERFNHLAHKSEIRRLVYVRCANSV